MGLDEFTQQLRSMRVLSGLDLGVETLDEPFVPLATLATLDQGRAAGLQHFATCIPASELRHLPMLTALTALTSLHVRSLSTTGRWASIASLTGLRMLQIDVSGEAKRDVSTHSSLAALTALRGLTHLDIADNWGATGPEDSWVSGLSHLTALCVLRCQLYQKARFVNGDARPIQLRFLLTAAALEKLDLQFLDSFWTLPRRSYLAMQQAVSSLASLKAVAIHINGEELEQYSLPLAVFAAAASIENLEFKASGRRGSLPDETHDWARACFKRLKKLKVLDQFGEAPSYFTELVLELSTTQLTRLALNLDMSALPLMQRIAGFASLRELRLSFKNMCEMFVEPLLALKELTRLDLRPNFHQRLGVQKQPGVVADEHWTRLRPAILESAREVGVWAWVLPDTIRKFSPALEGELKERHGEMFSFLNDPRGYLLAELSRYRAGGAPLG